MKYKVISISKALEKYGGKWKYNRTTRSWHCSDGRIAYYVSVSSSEDGYGSTDVSSLCIYGGAKGSEWAYL